MPRSTEVSWNDFEHMSLWVIVGEEELVFVTDEGDAHRITQGPSPNDPHAQHYWLIDGRFVWTDNPFWIGDLFWDDTDPTREEPLRMQPGTVWRITHTHDNFCTDSQEVIYTPTTTNNR